MSEHVHNEHFYTAPTTFIHSNNGNTKIMVQDGKATIYRVKRREEYHDIQVIYEVAGHRAVEAVGHALLEAARLLKSEQEAEEAKRRGA